MESYLGLFLGLARLVGWVGDLEWQLETVAMLRWDLWEGRYHGGHLLLCDTDSQAQHHWPGYWPTSNKKVVNSGFNCSAVCIASGGDYRPAVDYQRLQLQSTTMNSFRPSTNLLHGLPCNLIPLLDSGVAFAFNISASSCLVQVLLVVGASIGGLWWSSVHQSTSSTSSVAAHRPSLRFATTIRANCCCARLHTKLYTIQILQIQIQIQNLQNLANWFCTRLPTKLCICLYTEEIQRIHKYRYKLCYTIILLWSLLSWKSVRFLYKLYNYRNCISAPIWW